MKLNNRVYDILKWVVIIVIPAAATAYVSLSAVWGWPFADEISKTAAAVCMFLGTLLGISTVKYNQEQKPPADNE